ncbi:MAG: SpoIIE family protein phosphatase [Chloroflexota bacterium]|nr:SpoIIE family protein phosphatase [Chloroflexota bacterium]
MEIRIAVSKFNKYGIGKSGDTVESIERPNGGISVVFADGQINGKNQKSISTMVSHRVIDHISNGVRDGAAIRATSSRLFSEYDGSIKADLNVVSADLQTNTIIISRNNPVPVFLINGGKIDCLASFSESIGTRADITPTIVELEIQPNMAIIAFSDGVYNAGQRTLNESEIRTTIEALIEGQEPPAQELTDFLLHRAIRLDEGRPKDDMSVLVMQISPQSSDQIRRMNVSMTIDD